MRDALAKIGGLEYADVQAATRDMESRLAAVQVDLASAQKELGQVRDNLIDVRSTYSLQDVGLFNFDHPAESSAQLAGQLADVRQQIRNLVLAKRATGATANFTFNGSSAKGRQFVAALSKMMLQAYNAEAENCVKAVRAGNMAAASARLTRVMQQVANNGRMIDLHITPQYHALRVQELELASKQLLATQHEKESEKAERERLREQRKAEQELRAERERLEKERQHYMNALAALRDRGDAEGTAEMEAKLADVGQAIQSVDYRQANIRAGYVYVISNIGAFGPDMVKIGMTRRLDPMERVNELGSASVPFPYDVHALFFANDAVAVETMLHHVFDAQRVNRVNMRREFFNVTPAQVLEALRDNDVQLVEYSLEPVAEQWRLSGSQAPGRARPILDGGADRRRPRDC